MVNYAKSIHVIDDDRVVCHSLSQILNKHGFEVESFFSAEEYLAQINKDFDGYLLIDHKMEGMTGLELQETLREMQIKPTIIFITAMSDQVKERAIANGALQVFDKPFDLDKLISLLQDYRH